MELQPWLQLATGLAPTADGSALASSTSIGTISPNSSTNPPFTIPAGSLFPGAAMLFVAAGRFSNTGTPTLNLGLYYGGSGGSALATTGAVTTPSGVTNVPWIAVVAVVCRTAGSSGTLFSQGFASGLTAAAAGSSLMPASAPAAVTVDTTADKSIDFTATWSASSASNTITQHLWLPIALNFRAG